MLGERTSGSDGLALAMAFGGMMALPFVVAGAGALLADPLLPLCAFGVAVLSSLVPHLVELEALRRMPTSTFGVLMSAEPAVAAGIGFLLLGEELRVAQWAGIGLVVLVTVGSTRVVSDAAPQPTAADYDAPEPGPALAYSRD
ncbi:hypothetical protein GCM10027089_52970 [Nocardia thraciensis]